ncbi:MAG: hypothetical protein V3U46_02850 [Acidimicrobiia bacterium]
MWSISPGTTGTVVVVGGGVVVVVVADVVVVVVVVDVVVVVGGGVVVVVVVVAGRVVVVDGWVVVVVVVGRVVLVEPETTLVVVVGTGVVVVATVALVLVEEPAPGAGGCEVVVERSLAARTDTGGVMPPASGVAVSRLSLPKEFTPATSPPRRGSTKIITSRARRLTISAWP